MMSANQTGSPGLPPPVTASTLNNQTSTDIEAPPPSKWIRFGKHALLGFRGILCGLALATLVAAIACSASRIPSNPAIYGSSIYSFTIHLIVILFTFRRMPFHEGGWISNTMPGLVKRVRRWPGILLTLVDLGGIALMTLVANYEPRNADYDSRLNQVTFGLATGLGSGHWATMCGGWLFGIICIFKKCCTAQGRRDKVQKKKIEAMYEKARAEVKARELEEANRIEVALGRQEGKKMSKKERLEAAYEKARVERELVEKMVKEEMDGKKRAEVQVSGAIPTGTEEAAGALAESFAPTEAMVQRKKWEDMTKKERLQAKYEQARIEREANEKVKGKARTDDMV